MTIWQILTRRLKKYENLANFDWRLKKYENLAHKVLENSTRFSYLEEVGLEYLEGWEEEGSVNR